MKTIEHAPSNWQRRWFATPQHRRDRIEEHMEGCQAALAQIRSIDIDDRNQHELWHDIIKNGIYSLRHCSRLVEISNNGINQYLTGNRHPKGGRTRAVMSALLWNLTADRYHRHLQQMMWWTYWAERNEDAPAEITVDDDYLEWVEVLDDHPLFTDLPHGIAMDPAVDIYQPDPAIKNT